MLFYGYDVFNPVLNQFFTPGWLRLSFLPLLKPKPHKNGLYSF